MIKCLEHTGAVTELITEAVERKGDLVVQCQHGSIPHKLVETTLNRHHVPSKITASSWTIITTYNFRLRVTSGPVTSSWFRLEKGIIPRCKISITLFALTTNIVVKTAELQYRGPLTRSGVRPHGLQGCPHYHYILCTWQYMVFKVWRGSSSGRE